MTPLPKNLTEMIEEKFPLSVGSQGKYHRDQATAIATILWKDIQDLREALEGIDSEAEPMHYYNGLEFKMVLRAREALSHLDEKWREK